MDMVIHLRCLMKKNNITYKLFRQISLIVVIFSGIIIFTNTLLLKPIYLNIMENELVQAVEKLSAIDYSAEEDIWLEKVIRIDSGSGFDVTIFTQNGVIYSSSSEIGIKDEKGKSENYPTHYKNRVNSNEKEIEWKELHDNIKLSVIIDKRSQTEINLCMVELESNIKIITSQPLAPMNRSISVANSLYIIVTLFMLMITMIIISRFSKQFTKPIHIIQQQVAGIAALDFNDKVIIQTGDELEDLSSDVNKLSSKLEEALKTLIVQNSQLEKDIVSQKRFLSNASHELRTPLSLIKGYAEEIKSGYVRDSKQQQAMVSYIADESKKMQRLLNEILDLSRLESGHMDFEYINMNIYETIKSFIGKYEGFIISHGLDVEMDIDKSYVGKIDVIRFEQVLANYFSNASKYGDEFKKIKIFASTPETKETVIRISVYNSGDRIAENVLTHIWDDFYKENEARTSGQESYGLGLSIVKAIQTLAGFDYGAYNEDHGVVFWFDIEKVDDF